MESSTQPGTKCASTVTVVKVRAHVQGGFLVRLIFRISPLTLTIKMTDMHTQISLIYPNCPECETTFPLTEATFGVSEIIISKSSESWPILKMTYLRQRMKKILEWICTN